MVRTINPVEATPATSAAAEPLRVDGVSVTFGGVHALTDVSITVDHGSIVSIIGPNGAGKTTLLNAICGRVAKSHGTVSHFGKDVGRAAPTRIARGGVGRSFQDPRLLEGATVLENVLCGFHTTMGYGLPSQIFQRWKVKRCEERAATTARELLDLVELGPYLNSPVSELSYGARKIVDIVRATVSRPTLLLLDEPSSGLDRHERATVESMLLTIHREFDIPMLVVEHHMDLVRRISDTVVGLVSGAVAIVGPPAAVLDSAEFRALITGATTSAGALIDELPTEEEEVG